MKLVFDSSYGECTMPDMKSNKESDKAFQQFLEMIQRAQTEEKSEDREALQPVLKEMQPSRDVVLKVIDSLKRK